MKGKILYLVSAIIISLPWIFLLEILPIPYNQISTFWEIVIECAMFTALLIAASLLRKELKRLKHGAKETESSDNGNNKAGGRTMRLLGRILFILASFSIFVVGLILLLIGISYSL
jgi:hypothetical protein